MTLVNAKGEFVHSTCKNEVSLSSQMSSRFMSYLFLTQRLGFRLWSEEDIPKLYLINQDPQVMRYFPSRPTLQQTITFVDRMRALYMDKSYCYFAVDMLSTGSFLGFIGLADQDFPATFTPTTDIGWRLAPEYWNQGLATEGARRCLDHAFSTLQLQQIDAICPELNKPSERVMQKIGMTFKEKFQHPLLSDHPGLQICVRYQIRAT